MQGDVKNHCLTVWNDWEGVFLCVYNANQTTHPILVAN